MSPRFAVALALAILSATPAFATCQDFTWPLGNELAFFSTPGNPVVKSGADVPAYSLGGVAELQAVETVKFIKPPERAPEAGTLGAVFTVKHITVGGMYQVTLSEAAFVDALQDGEVLKPVAFTGNKDCAGLHKSVRYMIKPGPLVLQLSGAKAPRVNFVVLPAT